MLRTLDELINTQDPGWPIVEEWIASAKNKIEVLPCNLKDAEEALVNTQVTTRSIMGAIVYETGGILIDNGWIRILGAGCDKMSRSLPKWNKGKTFSIYGEAPPYLLIADDAIGGFFAINGGFFGEDAGNIYYYSPDMLEWLPLDIGYTDFILFCFHQDLNKFYEGLRWKNWEKDIQQLSPDYAYSFVPFLWTKEGSDINTVSRKAVPVKEVYEFNMEMQVAIKKEK